VAFVVLYYKGYRSSGNIKIIYQYLPWEVGELLVYYLWLVLPFWEKLQFQVSGSKSDSLFLWGNGQKKEHWQWTGPRRPEPVGQVHPEGRCRAVVRYRAIAPGVAVDSTEAGQWVDIRVGVEDHTREQ
jgi:hypothetical protein